ncbi:MAG TPA: GGDEF domain-containing protein [Frankiaceae bacterium]|nr:GGDEF domain-containing protein [Frankiaceae bacterium]
MTAPKRRGRVIDLTGSAATLRDAARGWLLNAAKAMADGEALPALPTALTAVRSLDRLADLSGCRFDVVKELVQAGHDYRVCDRLWDVLVWQLAYASESVLRDELAALARTDPLTGLLNRRGLTEALDRETSRARRTGATVSLVLLDLDRFKVLNDTHGHPAGDDALRAVADVLRRGLRGGDVAGRWGGDEFGIVFVDLEAEVAYDVVDRLRATLTHPSNRATNGKRVSFSAGVAALNGPDAVAEDLMAMADAALYEAKAAGGNKARRAAARPA